MSAITCQTEDLLDALKLVFPVSQKRTTLPALNHLLLASAGGQMHITATDGGSWATSAPISCDGGEGYLCIPAKSLKSVVENARSDSLEMKRDSGWLTISSGRSTAKLPTLDAGEFQHLPKPEPGNAMTVRLIGQELAETIRLASIASRPGDIEKDLVVFDFSGEELRVWAYGGAQYSHGAIKITSDKIKVGTSTEAAKLIAAMCEQKGADEPVLLSITGNLLSVQSALGCATCLLSSLAIKNPTAAVANYVEICSESAILEREALVSILSAATSLANDKMGRIKLGFGSGRVAVSGNWSGSAEFSDSVEAAHSQHEAQLELLAPSLLNYLSSLACERIRLSYLSATKPLLVEQVDAGNNSLYLQMVCVN